ncbi:sulfurtransferase TusA family protein [Desulfosoma caldarium]|uniref:Uncharacterized protein n=1 Tax=Desulfosoma caldarium TaxID=610254 RepID=A0A3N1USS8_9BACT|nr:sulfurtransferase TusA family protein [Desulfosoma caldarium]ROQ90911.1 hypothetical protein EDC27_2179 [Desulfosoma caldarium]
MDLQGLLCPTPGVKVSKGIMDLTVGQILGVDDKGTAVDQPGFYNFGPMGSFPLVAGAYSEPAIMKFAPAVALQLLISFPSA